MSSEEPEEPEEPEERGTRRTRPSPSPATRREKLQAFRQKLVGLLYPVHLVDISAGRRSTDYAFVWTTTTYESNGTVRTHHTAVPAENDPFSPQVAELVVKDVVGVTDE